MVGLEVTVAGFASAVGLISAAVGIAFIRIKWDKEPGGRLERWYLYLVLSSIGSVSLSTGLGLFQAVTALSSRTFEVLGVLGLVAGLAIGSMAFRLNEDQSVIGIRENKILQYEIQMRNPVSTERNELTEKIVKEQKKIEQLTARRSTYLDFDRVVMLIFLIAGLSVFLGSLEKACPGLCPLVSERFRFLTPYMLTVSFNSALMVIWFHLFNIRRSRS